MFQNDKLRPFLAAFCATGWSLAYPLIKLGYAELNIEGNDLGGKILFAGVRFFVAGLLVLLFAFFRKTKMAVPKEAAGLLFSFALVNTALHYMFSYIGLSYIQSSRSTILDSMGGFFLIILSCILFADDKININKVLGCILGLSGILVININPGQNLFEGISFLGDGMILLNACCTAFGGIIARLVSKRMNMMLATGYGMGIGGGLLILAGIVAGPRGKWNLSPKGILILTILILISAVCFGIYNMLLAYHPISKVAIYNALIPVLGVLFATIILGETFRWQYILAGILVASGVAVLNKKI